MTPSETTALIDKHLEGWLGGDHDTPILRDRIAAMIAEAEGARDKLWADGAKTLTYERDDALSNWGTWRVWIAVMFGLDAGAKDEELRSQLATIYRDSQNAVINAGSQRAAIEAAASFDATKDRDLETCVRNLYHSEVAHRSAFADAVKACSFMQDEQDELSRYGMKLGHRTTVEGIEALRRHRNELRDQLAAMTQSRDDAVQAAHIAAEESAKDKSRIDWLDAEYVDGKCSLYAKWRKVIAVYDDGAATDIRAAIDNAMNP